MKQFQIYLEYAIFINRLPSIHIGTRFDVIQGIRHAIQIIEKLVIEHILRLTPHPQLHGSVVGVGVHRLDSLHGCLGLVLLDVSVAEQELAIQIWSEKNLSKYKTLKKRT